MSATSPISLKGPAEVAHGWMFIGFTINVLLLGVMMTQVYMYYSQYKRDKAWMKIFVAALFLADIVNTLFVFLYLYRSFITFFGDADNLSMADWLFATDPAITGIIASAVQLFFAWRVLVLTKTRIYAGVIGAIAITGGVAAIVTAYEVGRTPRFVDFQNFKATVIVWLAAEAVGDVIITAILRKHKTGFQRSDMMIDRIIRITVQTGLITMIVASLDLIFFLIDPTGTHLLFNFPLCKLYSNSLMSSLNSRGGWQFSNNNTGADSEGQVGTSNFKLRNAQTGSKANDMINLDNRGHPAEVFVHVESHQLRDISKNNSDFDEKPTEIGTTTQSLGGQDEKWGANPPSQWSAT